MNELWKVVAGELANTAKTFASDYRERTGFFTEAIAAKAHEIPTPDIPGVSERLFVPSEEVRTLLSKPVTRGHNLLDTLNYQQISEKTVDKRRGDLQLGEILHQQGFDGPPTVTDKAGLNKVIDAGGIELYRAFPSASAARDFRAGQLHPATGHQISGLWSTTQYDEALSYSNNSNRDAVVRFALRPDAHVVHIKTLRAENYAAMGKNENRLATSPNEYLATNTVLTDFGRFGAARGKYDAIYAETSKIWPNAEQWVVLNRTAIVAQDTPP